MPPDAQRLEATFRDLAQQVTIDKQRGAWGGLVTTRFVAWRGAYAQPHDDQGVGWAYRQTLIDLASACVLVAAQRPQPSAPTPVYQHQRRAVGALMAATQSSDNGLEVG